MAHIDCARFSWRWRTIGKIDEEEVAMTTLEEQIPYEFFEQYFNLGDPQTFH